MGMPKVCGVSNIMPVHMPFGGTRSLIHAIFVKLDTDADACRRTSAP